MVFAKHPAVTGQGQFIQLPGFPEVTHLARGIGDSANHRKGMQVVPPKLFAPPLVQAAGEFIPVARIAAPGQVPRGTAGYVTQPFATGSAWIHGQQVRKQPCPPRPGIRYPAAARRPATRFASREEAAARYLRISGLAGLLPADDPAVEAGLREQDGRWRLAMDPGAFAVGAPDMTQLLARSRAPVTLARGEHDPMNTDEQLARLGVLTVTLPGLGHNAHVESPHTAITLIDPHRYAVNRPA